MKHRIWALLLLVSAQPAWNQDQMQQYLRQGEAALAGGRYAEAAEAYEKLRQLDPSAAAIHGRLGLVYYQQGRFADAAAALRTALKLQPALPRADILLAMSLSELGRYAESLPGLEKGFRQTSDPALRRMAGLQLQRAYTGLKQDSKAVDIALRMTELYPKDPEVLYHSGQLFGNYAYLTMRRLSEVARDSVWTIQAIGEAEESRGDYDAAIRRYRQVISMAPERPGIHFRLGRVLSLQSKQNQGRAEEPPEVMAAFEKELAIDPTNANAAYELGSIHLRRRNFEKARALFETALKHYPDFQEAQTGVGRALIALSKPDLAVTHLRKAVALDPNDDVAWFHLAAASRDAGDSAAQRKALAEFRRLRSQQLRQEAALIQRAVSKQEIDSDPAP